MPFWDPPPGRKIVGDVEFHGNEALSDGDIEERLHTHSDNWVFGEKPLLDLADVAADATRIESVYAAAGFFDARVLSYRIEPMDSHAVRVHYYVQEGGATVVRHVGLVGLEEALRQEPDDVLRLGRLRGLETELLAQLPMQPGEVWTESLHQTTKGRIVKSLADMGFVYVQLYGEVRVAREAQRCDVIYRVWPGPLVRVASVAVNGQGEVPAERILRRSDIEVGAVATAELLEQTRAQIYDLGVFYSVTVKVDVAHVTELLGGRPPTWDNVRTLRPPKELSVTIGVNETPMSEVRLGAGMEVGNVRTDGHVRAGFEHRNLFGHLEYLDLSVRPAYVVLPNFFGSIDDHGFGLSTDASLRFPGLIEEYTHLALSAEYELGVHVGYRSHSVGGGVAVSRSFLRALTVQFGYRARYYYYFNVPEDLKGTIGNNFGLAYRDESVLGYLEQLLTLDLRDHPVDAKDGVYAQLRVQEALWWLGSDFEYIRLRFDIRGFWTPWRHLTLALRLKYGQTFPLGSGEVPLPARIYGGGSADMRGYGASSMGADLCHLTACSKDVDVKIGGNIGTLLSFETRWNLGLEAPWDFGFVAFVDVGQVWTTTDQVTLASLDVAVGPGVRWATPVGPVRIDAGFLVKPAILQVPEFHISIGQAF